MPLRQLLSGRVGSPSAVDGAENSPGGDGYIDSLRHAERELWFLALSAMLIDITLTVHGLQLGLQEMNPLALKVLESVGVLGLYALKGMAVAVGLCGRLIIPDRANVIIPIALAVPSVIAVVINATLITTWVL